MACPLVLPGDQFLASALAHIDCQASTIGAYGWGALANPGSPVSVALTGFLAIFVALFGVRLILGHSHAAWDVVSDVLKVAIVLTLATSWPAWRTVGYNLIIEGPRDVAHLLSQGAGLPGASWDLGIRLQNVDQGLASLNVFGTGRIGIAQGDWLQLGSARLAFLTGTLLPLAAIRLCAGVLLALAPLMAALLLFGITRSVFEGWARGLGATFLGSIFVNVLLGAELAMLEPWLQDALERRAAEQVVLDAPVEILAMTVVFALASLISLFVAFRIAFHPAFRVAMNLERASGQADGPGTAIRMVADSTKEAPSHAHIVSQAVAENLRRVERLDNVGQTRMMAISGSQTERLPEAVTRQEQTTGSLGESWRRSVRRQSGAQRARDRS